MRLIFSSPFVVLSCGLAALYVGERTLEGRWRWIVDAAALLGVFAAFVAACIRVRLAQEDARKAWCWIAREYAWLALAGVLYAVQLPLFQGYQSDVLSTCIAIAWPACVALGYAPMWAMERAMRSLRLAPHVELWRLQMASRSARIIVLAWISFAGVNYAGTVWNKKIDLSHFKTASISASTRKLVESVSEPVEVLVFFPPANDVLERVSEYVLDVQRASPRMVQVRMADQAMDPELARSCRVQTNGTVVVRKGEHVESFKIPLDIESARKELRTLDTQFQAAFLKIIRPAKVVYFIGGHLERDYSVQSTDPRLSMADMKKFFEKQGIEVKRYGQTDGLGVKVPEDAALVVLADPQEALLESEKKALFDYVNKGGRMLVALEAETSEAHASFLHDYGMVLSKGWVANEHYLVRVEGRGANPYDLLTMKPSSHPTTATLFRNPGRMGVIVLRAGSWSRTPKIPNGVHVTMVLHSMSESWTDNNGNGVWDRTSEEQGTWPLVAAVEVGTLDPNNPTQGLGEDAGRVVFVSDADALGTGVLLRNPGNMYFFADTVRWLLGEETFQGPPTDEEDVAIVHRKDRDTLWFYGTSFIVPALVLWGGLAFTKGRGRKKREEKISA